MYTRPEQQNIDNQDGRPSAVNVLFVLALVVSLLTPLPIWKGYLPSSTRYIVDATLVVMMVGTYVRMMAFHRVPGAVWAIAAVSTLWSAVALTQGQAIAATAWGWWLLFQYPLLGLYAYLQPPWPRRFPDLLLKCCVATLAVQTLVQIGQYRTGQEIGDDLAGLFGWHGTAQLAIFTLLVLCLALGKWLAHRQWQSLVVVAALGTISSVLGEIKFFPVAALIAVLLAVGVYIVQGGRLWRLAPYPIFLAIIVYMFFNLYDAFVPNATRIPLEQYLQLTSTDKYLGGVDRNLVNGAYTVEIKRNYAIAYGWNAIQKDPITVLFGLGLGARGESRTLGTVGVGLQEENIGSTGSSFLIMIQEMGLVGMLTVVGFLSWVIVAMFKGVKNNPNSEATELRYALLLFSILWPLWLWYTTAWISRVPMILYWAALGYVLSEPLRHRIGSQAASRGLRLPSSIQSAPARIAPTTDPVYK